MDVFMFPEALPTVDLGGVAAGPVLLQVGTAFVDPTEVWYEPMEGATTDPYPSVPWVSVPEVCASANVLASELASVSAVASAMAETFVTFMMVSFALR
jgi:hypothetical protein